MRLVIVENNKARINKFFDWLIHILAYTLIFISVSFMFKSFYIDMDYYGVFGLLAVLIIYVLNKTVKPILVFLTLPITGVTLGLFYPVINLVVLKLTDWILGSHFNLNNLLVALFISVLISVFNILVDEIILKPLLRKVNHHE